MGSYTYDHPRPMVTVDVVVWGRFGDELRLLLVQRGKEPFTGQWALPGGFLEIDEELEDGARRELREETGLEVGELVQLGAFGKLGRDPRGRTISVVWITRDDCARLEPRAGSDAAAVAWHALERPPELAFDHADIVRCARRALERSATR